MLGVLQRLLDFLGPRSNGHAGRSERRTGPDTGDCHVNNEGDKKKEQQNNNGNTKSNQKSTVLLDTQEQSNKEQKENKKLLNKIKMLLKPHARAAAKLFCKSSSFALLTYDFCSTSAYIKKRKQL